MDGNAEKMKPRVLVVDDEDVILAAIRKVFEYEGFEMDAAESVMKGREFFAAGEYSALVADLMMPGEYGDALLREAFAAKPDMPAVLISGYATVDNALGAIRDGAFDFLPKPFSFEELSALANRLKRFLALPRDKRIAALRLTPAGEDAKTLFCLGGHAWALVNADGTASIGAGKIPAATCGRVALIRLPKEGDTISIGHYFAHLIDDEGYEHPVLSPLSGRVTGTGTAERIPGDPDLLPEGSPKMLVKILPGNLDREIGLLTRCGGFAPQPE